MSNNKVVSIRLSNKAEWIASFQIAHDFINSHGRKREDYKDLKNYAISLDSDGSLIKEEFQRDLATSHYIRTLFNRHNKLIGLITSIKKEIKVNWSNESTRELLQETLLSYQTEMDNIHTDIKSHLKSDNNLGLKYYDQYLNFEKQAKKDWKSVKGREMQGNTNLFINGLISFGNEESNLSRLELNELNHDDLDIAAHRAVHRLAKENGVKVIYIVKHLEEAQIHYHYALENYNFTTHKTVATAMRAKSYLKSTQDLVAEEFEHLGFQRGKGSDVRLLEYLESNEISREEFQQLSYKQKQKIYKLINSKRVSDYKKSTVDAKDALYLQQQALKELEVKKKTLVKYKQDLEATITSKAKRIVYNGKPSRETILKRVIAQLQEISKFEFQLQEIDTLRALNSSLKIESDTLSTKNSRTSHKIKLLNEELTSLKLKNTELKISIDSLYLDIAGLEKDFKFNYHEWKQTRESSFSKFRKDRELLSKK